MVEQADTPDSNSGAARRGGSTPSTRTAIENLRDWNAGVFADARRKAEERFDDLLHERKNRRPDKDMPTLF